MSKLRHRYGVCQQCLVISEGVHGGRGIVLMYVSYQVSEASHANTFWLQVEAVFVLCTLHT